MLLFLWACRPTPEPLEPEPELGLVAPPVLSEPRDAPLARRLQLQTEEPTRLHLTLSSGEGALEVTFPGLAVAHDVPVLGLWPDHRNELVIRLEAEDGREITLDPLEIVTDPLPVSFPTVEALAHDLDASEAGYWLISLEIPQGDGWLAVLDVRTLQFVWWYSGINLGDARATRQGTVLGVASGGIEINMLGELLQAWGQGDSAIFTPLPWQGLHHELYPLDDGTYVSLTKFPLMVPSYPTSYEDPTPQGPASIANDWVVGFTEEGEELFSWSLAARVDTERIGYESLNKVHTSYDWSHTNAVLPDGRGGFIVSMRHQDALLRLDETGALRWIAGDPHGWGEAYRPYLLSPVGSFPWHYHQHGPALAPDGTLVVFDNHNHGATPYEPLPEDPGSSRVVAYTIDEDAHTIALAWEWVPEPALVSSALGNVDILPETGHVLATFGRLGAEGEVSNADAGRGAMAVRLVELVPGEEQPVVDLRLSTALEVSPAGIVAYRSTFVPSLYPPEVQVTYVGD